MNYNHVNPKTVDRCLVRLSELEALEPGWLDGAGRRVTKAALQTARDLLPKIQQANVPLPFIYPSPEGGIGFEWDSTEELHFFIDISSRGNAKLDAWPCRGPMRSITATTGLYPVKELREVLKK